jgi:3-phenylpropionate/trans-cinnamate dioxygenase ferredoxin subunit
MSEGIRVAGIDDIEDGEALRVPASVTGADDAIAIFHDGGEFFALNDTCTHAQASLSEGWIENGEVECPLHAGRFCLRNGEVLSMPATQNTVAHRVEVIDGEIFVHIGQPAVS